MSMQEGQGQETGTAPVIQQNEGQGAEEPSEYSLAGDFLKDVPDEHRPILEPYLKKWDAGVTRRFQELNGKFKPYEELGFEADDLPAIKELYRMVSEEPETLYQRLHEALEQSGSLPNFQQQIQPVGDGTQGLPPEFEQFREQFNQQNEMLKAIAQIIVEDKKTAQQQQEERELELYMKNLHTEFGDFDDKFVLTLMAQKVPAEQAIKQYNDAVQAKVNEALSATNRAPVLLGGGGTIPAEQTQVTDLSNKDTRKVVEHILAAQAQQG